MIYESHKQTRKKEIAKATKGLVPTKDSEEKYRDILNLYIKKGMPKERVLDELTAKYHITRTRAALYMSRCLNWLTRDTALIYGVDEARVVQVGRFEEIYHKCFEAKNYKVAIEALRELNKLLMLTQDVNVFNTQNNTQINVNKDSILRFEFGKLPGVEENTESSPNTENTIEVNEATDAEENDAIDLDIDEL
mgnify:CR=1 FL=1